MQERMCCGHNKDESACGRQRMSACAWWTATPERRPDDKAAQYFCTKCWHDVSRRDGQIIQAQVASQTSVPAQTDSTSSETQGPSLPPPEPTLRNTRSQTMGSETEGGPSRKLNRTVKQRNLQGSIGTAIASQEVTPRPSAAPETVSKSDLDISKGRRRSAPVSKRQSPPKDQLQEQKSDDKAFSYDPVAKMDEDASSSQQKKRSIMSVGVEHPSNSTVRSDLSPSDGSESSSNADPLTSRQHQVEDGFGSDTRISPQQLSRTTLLPVTHVQQQKDRHQTVLKSTNVVSAEDKNLDAAAVPIMAHSSTPRGSGFLPVASYPNIDKALLKSSTAVSQLSSPTFDADSASDHDLLLHTHDEIGEMQSRLYQIECKMSNGIPVESATKKHVAQTHEVASQMQVLLSTLANQLDQQKRHDPTVEVTFHPSMMQAIRDLQQRLEKTQQSIEGSERQDVKYLDTLISTMQKSMNETHNTRVAARATDVERWQERLDDIDAELILRVRSLDVRLRVFRARPANTVQMCAIKLSEGDLDRSTARLKKLQ